jgi:UDP-N-acetylglucosamine 2-epimerase
MSTFNSRQHATLINQSADYIGSNLQTSNRLNDIICSGLISSSIKAEDFDYVLVQGDTTTAFTMALWAFNNKIKIFGKIKTIILFILN